MFWDYCVLAAGLRPAWYNQPMPSASSSLSIIVTALNEERNIAQMARDLRRVARMSLPAFEIILVNDGSSDATGRIMDELAAEFSEFSVVHHPTCRGMGAVFQSGLDRARMGKMLLLPGDGAYNAESLIPLFMRVSQADIVTGYRQNLAEGVTPWRLLISRGYLRMIRGLFGLPLRDIHGPAIFPVAAVKAVGVNAEGITFQMETLVKLVRSGLSVSEGPVRLNVSGKRATRSLALKSFESLGRSVVYLLSARSRMKAPPARRPAASPSAVPIEELV